MKKVIIIRGPLGIGKSTISMIIAEKLNGKYISIDKVIDENNLDVKCPEVGCIAEKSFLKVNEILLPKIRELSKEKIVVIDGNFYHKSQLENLVEELGEDNVIVFTLKAPLEVCIERDKNREKTLGEGATFVVHKWSSRFDYGHIVDTSKLNLEESVSRVMDIVRV